MSGRKKFRSSEEGAPPLLTLHVIRQFWPQKNQASSGDHMWNKIFYVAFESNSWAAFIA